MPTHPPVSIAVLLHLSSLRNWADFQTALQHLPRPFDLFINLVEGLNSSLEIDRQRNLILKHFPDARIVQSSNRGMDIGGMFRLFEQALSGEYRAVLYAHSKSDDNWRRQLLTQLTQHSKLAITALTQHSNNPIGMVGAYSYPFDYYNLGPFLRILEQLDIKPETSWERYFSRYPAMRTVPIEQRIAHARDACPSILRPELDIEYAYSVLGSPEQRQQSMNPDILRRFVADKVVSALPYFPGNFFWISMPLIRKLQTAIDFRQERARLPLNLQSDQQLQSRAHAWERALPVFVAKSGYRLYSLQSQSTL